MALKRSAVAPAHSNVICTYEHDPVKELTFEIVKVSEDINGKWATLKGKGVVLLEGEPTRFTFDCSIELKLVGSA